MLFTKRADHEVNEANALVRIPLKTVRFEFPKSALEEYGFKMPQGGALGARKRRAGNR